MDTIKKYGIKILALVAFIALFFPMASIEVNGYHTTSLSGFTVAFQGYICMLLIAGPIAILASDFIAFTKRIIPLVQVAISAFGIILTFVGYLQASNIAAAGDAVGMGFVDCEASFGFGGILCLLSYAGILVLTVLFQKKELMENIASLKNTSKK